MKALLLTILIAVGLLISSCAMFRTVRTQRLASDTSVVLYSHALSPVINDSVINIYLPKGYDVDLVSGPDFGVGYYNLHSSDSSRYIGFAGSYSGMSPMRTETEDGETFITVVTRMSRRGKQEHWNLYRTTEGWSLKTADRLWTWIFAPTRELAMRWLEILDTERKDPG
jgi:hypothetical protein